MENEKVTRRDFIKVTAATTAVAATALVAKEVVDELKEANIGDLEVVQETTKLSCMDLFATGLDG